MGDLSENRRGLDGFVQPLQRIVFGDHLVEPVHILSGPVGPHPVFVLTDSLIIQVYGIPLSVFVVGVLLKLFKGVIKSLVFGVADRFFGR